MIYRKRYEWIEYPTEKGWNLAYAGFRAKVLVNANGLELHEETKLFMASESARPVDTDDPTDSAELAAQELYDAQEAYFRYVADRVPEWNYQAETVEGDIKAVPAPGESPDNWKAFYLLEWPLCIWLRSAIHYAHLPKAWAGLGGEVSVNGAGSTDSTPTTPTPLRRRNSSKPSASASTA